MPKAVWNGKTIAESDDVREVDGNMYFPKNSVRAEYLIPSDKQTEATWKGEATYFHLEVDGKRNADAAWCYPQPKKEASKIKGYVAFWKGVEVFP